MYTGVTPIYVQTADAYLANSQNSIVYCNRFKTQYVCEYLRSASSSAAEGDVLRPGSFID